MNLAVVGYLVEKTDKFHPQGKKRAQARGSTNQEQEQDSPSYQ